MQVDFTKTFDKQFAKLPHKKQLAAKNAIALFLQNQAAPELRIHRLKGEWRDYCSMSAGGDLRLHFRIMKHKTVLFVAVGSHSQLYK